jgi:hypothetical protein
MQTYTMASEIAELAAKQTDEELLSQLNEHISRGLIVVERTNTIMVQDPLDKNKIELRMGIRLKLMEQEYIEKLENKLKAIKKHMEHPRKDLNWLDYLQNRLLGD